MENILANGSFDFCYVPFSFVHSFSFLFTGGPNERDVEVTIFQWDSFLLILKKKSNRIMFVQTSSV